MLADLQQGQGTAGKLLKDPALLRRDAQQRGGGAHASWPTSTPGKGTAGKLLNADQLHQQISATIMKLDTTLDQMNAGQGTIGQLLVNPQLYEYLNGATNEMNGLMKDFRANPKKFLQLQLKLF